MLAAEEKIGMKHTKENYQILANTIRFLSLDAVEKAKSGHPGMPLGMADIVSVLWMDHINLMPKDYAWAGRDRFILSNGHGSMLQYAINFLSGYQITIDDIKNFRQLGSITAGHPEYEPAAGIETTTGPLGQGFANAVGVAMALADQQPKSKVYVTIGDGCLMEGISQEAASLAGTWQLSNLVAMWDDNGISIDGQTDSWFSEDVPLRFEANGWQVIRSVDGHDYQAIDAALNQAKQANRPVLIQFKTTIGKGLRSISGTSKVHGAPVGQPLIDKMREDLSWSFGAFEIPPEVNVIMKSITQRWQNYYDANPKITEVSSPSIDTNAIISEALDSQQKMATRAASQWVIKKIAPGLTQLMVGSADLKESNLVGWDDAQVFGPQNYQGRYVHFGVREFAMFAIANGLALTGKLPAVATFLTFMDYGRNAMRLAAMMQLSVIYVLTHDSVGVGEDGPTHQPIEHLAICRATPGLTLWRPASLLETAVSWTESLKGGPHVLALSRQKLAPIPHKESDIQKIKKGAYVLYETDQNPQVVIFSSGSETAMIYEALEELEGVCKSLRIVSVPSMDRFLALPLSEQKDIRSEDIPIKLVVEAGSSSPWYQIAHDATMITIDTFGASAPGDEILAHKGISLKNVKKVIMTRRQAFANKET